MEASSIELNKNLEKCLDLIVTWIIVSENLCCLGKCGVEFQKFRRSRWVAGGQMGISYKY
jgi:hypothetical protein